jgi:hypothetical protein
VAGAAATAAALIVSVAVAEKTEPEQTADIASSKHNFNSFL